MWSWSHYSADLDYNFVFSRPSWSLLIHHASVVSIKKYENSWKWTIMVLINFYKLICRSDSTSYKVTLNHKEKSLTLNSKFKMNCWVFVEICFLKFDCLGNFTIWWSVARWEWHAPLNQLWCLFDGLQSNALMRRNHRAIKKRWHDRLTHFR